MNGNRQTRRYLFFAGSLKAGGAERSLSRLVNFLVDNGIETHLVLRKDLIQFELREGVQVHVLKQNRGATMKKMYKLQRELRRLTKRIQPTAVCAFTSLSGVILSTLLHPNTTVRFDTYPRQLRPWKQSLFYTFYNLPNVRNIVCLTRQMQHDLRRIFPGKRLKVINNASILPSPDKLLEPLPEHLKPTRPYLVALGRLTKTKAYDVAIKAYHRARIWEEADLFIIGDGGSKVNLEELVDKLDIGQYVHFAGYLANPYPLVKDAVCLVHTSVREGFPNVLVEALSLQVPVIATDCKTGPSEIIIDSENGYLVPVGDVKAIAKKMRHIVTDHDDRNRMRSKSLETIDQFNEKFIFRQWIDVLDRHAGFTPETNRVSTAPES